MSARFPGMKFSFQRLGIAILVAVSLVVGIGVMIAYQVQSLKPLRVPWSGGYVDVTNTPIFDFESRTGSGQKNVVLSFIVAENNTCSPSWGNYYNLSEADRDLDLNRRIAQVQRSGRISVLSFGGRDNRDLASACGDAQSTAEAMAQAIDLYDVTAIDLDIEGDALLDESARAVRVEAIELLQARAKAEDSQLAVWLTLPADANGLTHSAWKVVDEFIESGVLLSGVNLMTMNFGIPSTTESLGSLSIRSLEAAHAQLTRMYLSHGQIVTSNQVWNSLGATPMVGQNDEENEVFTVQDAITLHTFAQSKNLGRLSFWSLNRDRQCDANYTDWSTVANHCSGVSQEALEFDSVLGSDREGTADQIPDQPATDPSPLPVQEGEDDPATSPYPVWSAGAVYLTGDKVVWHHNVYTALWTNEAFEPDQTDQSGQTAWRLIGPVLEGEEPRPVPTLPEGTYPLWDPDTVYDTGDRVMIGNHAYQAKWWTQGDSPEASTNSSSTPWRPLTDDEIGDVLESTKG